MLTALRDHAWAGILVWSPRIRVNTTEPLTITLAIERRGEPVQTHEFRGAKALVGREAGEIVLRDAETSALHAELDCTAGHVIVRDLGSSNGTWRSRIAADGSETWERLPQFALLVGGCFRCGSTVIRLLSVDGAVSTAVAGRTVVSGAREEAPPRSQVTSPRIASRAAPPSSAVTVPGSDSTIIGQAPVPPPTPARPVFAHQTEPFATEPFATAPIATAPVAAAPVTTAPIASPPVGPSEIAGSTATLRETAPAVVEVDAGSTMRAPTPNLTEPALPTGATVLAPTRPVDPAPPPPAAAPGPQLTGRPPVANALIQPGRAQGRPITGPAATVARRSPRKWLRTAGLAAAVLAVVGIIGGGVWWAVGRFTGGPPALAVVVAKELPEDTLAFVAVASLRSQLEILGDAVPPEMRKQATEGWGFDPFGTAGWEANGLDPDAEIGFALLDVSKPTIAISMGLADAAKLRATLPALVAKIARVPEPKFSERTFGSVAGLWLESPVPTAILLRDRRVMAIVGLEGSDASAVARHAERLATLDRDATLASRPGFTAVISEPGTPLLVAYVDGVSMRSAVPAGAGALLAIRTGFGEVDAFSFTLSSDGPRIHAGWQTVLREGSAGLQYVGDVERSGRALARIPGPALASIDLAFAPDPVVQTLTAFASLAGVMSPAEAAFKEASNLDLRSDVIDNIAGEFGVVVQRLPSKPNGLDFGMTGFFSVKDTKKASTALATALPALQRILSVPATTETIANSEVHTFTMPVGAESFRLALVVTADHMWVAAGEVDVRGIVEGSAKSIGDTARHDAIREAVKAGDTASGFADIRGLLAASDPLMSESSRAEKTSAAALLEPLEVITVRARTSGRVARALLTLHTSAGQAMPTLVRAALQVAGDAFVKAVGRERRVAECARLVAQLEAIALTDTSRTVPEFALRFDVREACEKQATAEQLACTLGAKSFADIDACGGADAGLLPPVPEPQAVPYVEDIWPNTRSSPSDGAAPRADVNYGVEVGSEPQFRGRADALVTIIEFGDFQCPYCREVTSTIDDLLARHGDDVRVVFRHNPLAIHADAKPAAKAALAAARQDKFWAMHDRLFESQFELASGKFHDYAVALGLDGAKFDTDFADAALDRRLAEDLATVQRFGVTGTPAFFINGRFLSGNQPAAVFDRVINEELSRARTFVERRGNTRKRLYEDMVARWATEVGRAAAAALPPDTGERFNLDTTAMPSRGATGFARVKLVECGDFECPYCQRVTKTLQRILADYPTQVTMVFAHNPLSFHSNAEPAARAAAAAELQGKFWEMHDKLFAAADSLSEAAFVLYAKELKLDVDKFKADLASAAVAKTVADQKKVCGDNGGSSTPTFFLNGRRIEGAQSFETFKALINAELLGGL